MTEAELLGARGDWALFGAKYGRQLDLEDPAILRGLYALDLASGTWLDGPYPDHLPAIFVEKDEPEDAWLTDWRGQRGPRAPRTARAIARTNGRAAPTTATSG
ncbi:hypothetical protein [Nannocystis pusilla]|uniref:hypothetical protein n=1 Tax=Nannocystis pusilla TaxID=889268 RepID=UPI003B7A20FB